MPTWFVYIIEFLLLTFILYRLLKLVAPFLIFSTAQKKANSAFNTLKYHQLPVPELKDTAMPDPDFLYVSGFYDLTKGPLRISGDIAQTDYWSIAFYQNDTINYYVKNRRQIGEEAQRFDLVLKLSKQEISPPSDAFVVTSPTAKGVLLIRILVSDRQNRALVEQCEKWQKSVKLQVLDN